MIWDLWQILFIFWIIDNFYFGFLQETIILVMVNIYIKVMIFRLFQKSQNLFLNHIKIQKL
jgi:hypothetical protein